jgi:hypothetical protein
VLELSAEHAAKSTRHLIVPDLREAYFASPVSDRPAYLSRSDTDPRFFRIVECPFLGTQMSTDAALAFGASTST